MVNHPGIRSWKNLLIYSFNAFSIPLLLATLFSPWERDTAKGSKFSFFERFVFSIISRILGFIVRVFFIGFGFLFTFVMFLTFPIFFFIPIDIRQEYLERLPSFGAFLSYGSTFKLNAHSHDVFTPSALELYGKEKVLRMIERGLAKDTNHNVLLVGESGVGKSVVISHLGRLGQSGLSFEGIRNHRVVVLSTEGLSPEDFDGAMREAAEAGNVAVVIENIHEYPSLYERLAKYLAVPHFSIIATTDFTNYDQVLKAYPEFLSKFEKVDMEPTTKEDTFLVLKNSAHLNKISIKDDALQEIASLSDRYIGNQPEPLKSLLVLEELKALHRRITVDDVKQVVSDKTNIPIGDIGGDEKKVLIELEQQMRSKIVGQDEAVKEVSESLRRLRTGVADPSKPAGAFLFLGPTGVGKTYTAKILAESYFGHKNAMVRFDMTEFSLPTSVNIFADRLASVIEERPLSLVFFDELEKANRAIHHLLLQVLDEGRLTRDNGRVASFKEAIIIATSNAGSTEIISNPMIDKKSLIDDLIKNDVFAPEFFNRFSSVVLFKPLSQAQAKSVAMLLLNEFKERLFADKKIKLLVTEALVDKVAEAGFDPMFGARPIKRAIEEMVENKVADYIMSGHAEGELKIL